MFANISDGATGDSWTMNVSEPITEIITKKGRIKPLIFKCIKVNILV